MVGSGTGLLITTLSMPSALIAPHGEQDPGGTVPEQISMVSTFTQFSVNVCKVGVSVILAKSTSTPPRKPSNVAGVIDPATGPRKSTLSKVNGVVVPGNPIVPGG